jgi:hypothetical protein
MDKMKIKHFIVILVVGCSCNPRPKTEFGINYLQNNALSDRNGIILDSSQFFFPGIYMQDSASEYSKGIDTFKLKWYSSNLFCFKEPILYNYYLGYERFRFLWIRSFHRPVLITVSRDKKITINTKILKTIPDFWTRIYLPEDRPHTKRSGIGALTDDVEMLRKEFPNADSIALPKHNIKIILDTTQYISKNQWNRILELIDSCNFWQMKPSVMRLGLDGASWILEAQTEEKYQFVERWSPQDSYATCCEYIIKLSAARKEEIY